MTPAEAEQFLSATFRPLLTVHSSHALYAEALRITGRYQLPWFDSVIVASALEGECSVLYSEDLQDGQNIESLRVVNPFK